VDGLILENVRCFHKRHEIRLAPLTLLVGENSTGKSTLLAATRLGWDLARGIIEPDFNEEPFGWGAYDQIAHFHGGKAGRAKSFIIGFKRRITVPHGSRSSRRESDAFLVFEATFRQRGAQPALVALCWRRGHSEISASFEIEPKKVTITFKPERKPIIVEPQEFSLIGGEPVVTVFRKVLSRQPKQVSSSVAESISLLHAIVPWSPYFHFRSRPYAIAPIRTRPQRTYDPRRETPRPEGEHVPMILASGDAAGDEKWARLHAGLQEFGMQSGLFSNLDVKRLGKKETDPFQLQLAIQGPPVNLMDVGYGVSQILPIAVDCLTSEQGQMLLMQQPEVHLHPRAQAELGTFLAHLVRTRRNRFIVETHSDYLVNRVRLDIRDKKWLKPEDVCLLYCERAGAGVKVQEIHIDDQGNLLDAPAGYHRFLLDEEKRFFEG